MGYTKRYLEWLQEKYGENPTPEQESQSREEYIRKLNNDWIEQQMFERRLDIEKHRSNSRNEESNNQTNTET